MSLQLQLEWEPRWRSLSNGLAVVLHRESAPLEPGPGRLAVHPRSLATSVAFHAALILALCFAPAALDRVQDGGVVLRLRPAIDTLYYTPDRPLPEVADASGAAAGAQGASGGAHLFRPRQVVRIARGASLTDAIIDAPQLRLTETKDAAANLLALLRATPQTAAFAAPDVTAIHARVRPPQAPDPVAPALQVAARLQLPAAAPVMPTAAPVVLPPNAIRAALAEPAAPQFNVEAKLQLPAGMLVMPTAAPVVLPANAPAARAAAPAAPAVSFGGGPPQLVPSVPVMPSAAPVVLPSSMAGSRTAVAAPAPSLVGGGSPGNTQLAAILSASPGKVIGAPAGAMSGSASMSPRGGAARGLGGSGGAIGAGRGDGYAVGAGGFGSGGASHGRGNGADTLARGGLAPGAGPGGAGTGNAPGLAPGIAVSGGVVDLPSFGGTADPAPPLRAAGEQSAPPAVVIVATSRSGGGLAEYGVLRGGRVYTTYLDTARGSVVLQFADPAAAAEDFGLTPPRPLSTRLPGDGRLLRTVISCVLDRSGAVRDARVLDTAAPQLAAALLQALHDWRFRPALRGDHAIAVNVILGFGVSTQ